MSGGRRASESFVGDRHFVITPSDTVNFTDPDATPNIPNAQVLRPIDACVVVLSAGTVALVDTHGTVVNWVISTVPFMIPVRARRVNLTNTTPGINLIGVW
jgi:hypothetical protein